MPKCVSENNKKIMCMSIAKTRVEYNVAKNFDVSINVSPSSRTLFQTHILFPTISKNLNMYVSYLLWKQCLKNNVSATVASFPKT